ncbi:hypothetical protein C8J57DRAFT_1330597 [Mycena rebaudengoi]|nr:hypothetical protein C8J57DRAFT_1330597 [Mycena rebaudengoi]
MADAVPLAETPPAPAALTPEELLRKGKGTPLSMTAFVVTTNEHLSPRLQCPASRTPSPRLPNGVKREPSPLARPPRRRPTVSSPSHERPHRLRFSAWHPCLLQPSAPPYLRPVLWPPYSVRLSCRTRRSFIPQRRPAFLPPASPATASTNQRRHFPGTFPLLHHCHLPASPRTPGRDQDQLDHLPPRRPPNSNFTPAPRHRRARSRILHLRRALCALRRSPLRARLPSLRRPGPRRSRVHTSSSVCRRARQRLSVRRRTPMLWARELFLRAGAHCALTAWVRRQCLPVSWTQGLGRIAAAVNHGGNVVGDVLRSSFSFLLSSVSLGYGFIPNAVNFFLSVALRT